jgi:hypothetical protein
MEVIEMSVKILEIKKENCPAARLIGKKYVNGLNWSEWWENNWFSILEKIKVFRLMGTLILVRCVL